VRSFRPIIRDGIHRLSATTWPSGKSIWGDETEGRDLAVDHVQVHEEDVPSHVALLLGLSEHARVIIRSRRYVLDGKPVLMSRSYLPAKLVDIARLRQAGARPAGPCPAGPPPAGHAPGVLAATSCVEVQRLVNSSGIITLGNQVIAVGSPLAGQRARIRLDGQVMHVITQDGILWRTLPCPVPPGQRHKLQGVRLAGRQPLPPASPLIQRKVSSRGGIQVARQRVHVGLPHAGQVVTIELGDTTLRVTDPNGEVLTTVPRTSTSEISRFKAYGSKHSH
jgi:hypothetical protein